MSCRYAIRFRNFHFAPRGQMRVEKRRFIFPVKFVFSTASTFSGVDKRYSRIWLDVSCRFAIRIRNFHFVTWGRMRVDKWLFCRKRLVTWNPSTFHKVVQWYSRIWLGMSSRCAIRFFNFKFHPWSQIRVENWRFFSEFCNLNSM